MRSVRTVVTASAVSTLGDAAVMVALVLRVHESGTGPWAVSLLLLCFALPVVLTMGLAGAVADRLDRRRVLVVTGLAQAGAVGGLVLVDGLAATCALVLVLQTGFALGQPSWQSVVPTLVPDGEAGRVIALQHGLRGVAGPAGAGLGGLLAQWGGPSSALAPSLLAFLLLAAAARTLPPRPAPGAPVAAATERDDTHDEDDPAGPSPHATTTRGWLASVLPRDGVAALRADPGIGVLVLVLLPLVVTLESVNVVEVFLLRDVLGASPAQYGLSEAVAGVAAIGGAVAAGLLARRTARVRAVLVTVTLISAGQVLQGLVPTYLAYVVVAAGLGALLGLLNAAIMALLVDELDPARRGSVLALVGGLSRAGTAFALLLGGSVGTLAGPRTAYLVAGGAGLVVAAVAWAVHRSVDGRSTARTSHDDLAPATLEAWTRSRSGD